jgi:alkylated DNA repair dioxygenase AlkB
MDPNFREDTRLNRGTLRALSAWQRHTLAAEPRSLYLISGESRTVWEHSIPGVEAPRTSIAFRTMVDRAR